VYMDGMVLENTGGVFHRECLYDITIQKSDNTVKNFRSLSGKIINHTLFLS
jgi:hypothetical protein